MKLIEFDKVLEPLACNFEEIIYCSLGNSSEKYAMIWPKMKETEDIDDLASYRPLYNISAALGPLSRFE